MLTSWPWPPSTHTNSLWLVVQVRWSHYCWATIISSLTLKYCICKVWLCYIIQTCIFIQLADISVNTKKSKNAECVVFCSVEVFCVCFVGVLPSGNSEAGSKWMGRFWWWWVSYWCQRLAVIALICFLNFVRYAPSKRWHIDTIMRVLTTVSEVAFLVCDCIKSF